MEILTELFRNYVNFIYELSGNNDMLASFVFLFVSGVISGALYKIPKITMSFIRARLLVTVQVFNDSYVSNKAQTLLSGLLLKNIGVRTAKSLTMETKYVDEMRGGRIENFLVLGYGNHLMFYRGVPFVVNISEKESKTQQERTQRNISLTTLKVFHRVIEKLTKDILPEEEKNALRIFGHEKGGWILQSTIEKSSLQNLALTEEVREPLMKKIKFFMDNKDEYKRIGIPHKETILFSGRPGTGKTSLIKALASEFDMNLLILNLNLVTDASIRTLLTHTPENSIILIEDFDSSKAVHTRVKKKPREPKTVSNDFEGFEGFGITLSGFLNALDGVLPVKNTIICLTTNHIEMIDPAVLRSGRVDEIIELPTIPSLEVKRHFESIYGDLGISVFPELLACEINAIKSLAKLDKNKVHDLLIEKVNDVGVRG